MDRRIQKTKKLLSQALLELILEKGYEHVTVQDILDRANVGRSTFYAHYESKELLLVDGPRNLGHSLFGDHGITSAEAGRPRLGFHKLFQHVSEHLRLAKAMFGKESGNIMMASFRTQVASDIREHYKDRFSSGRHHRLVLKYLAEAGAAAVGSLLASWVDDDLALPVEEMSLRCRRMLEGMFSSADSA